MRTITGLKVQQRNRERVNVYLDGEFAFGLARIVAAWLYVGQELSDEKIQSLVVEDQRETAYQKTLSFIQYRERSEAEVQKNLKERGVPEEVAADIVERLRRSGLVNDQRFAQAWVENRKDFHPRSRRALAYELRQKGLDPDVIDQALDEVDDEKLAIQAALKQARRFQHLEWPDFRKKMVAFLARRGFPYEVVAAILPQVWEEQQADGSSYTSLTGLTPDEEDSPGDSSSQER